MNESTPTAAAEAAATASTRGAAPAGLAEAAAGTAPSSALPPGRVAGIPPTVQAAVMSVRAGARWFWWIAGLSAVNSAMSLAGQGTHFVLGLGITAIGDELFRHTHAIGLAVVVLTVAAFFWLGQQAQRGKRWAFWTGLALYVPDTLIWVLGQDWMAVGFHVLAAFFIVRGLRALNSLQPAQ